MKTRPLVDKIIELVKENDLVIGLLPTGYGKSSIPLYYWDKIRGLGRFIHILPLRAIVEDLTMKLTSTLGMEVVSYQAHVKIENTIKSPFLSTKYVVTTLDSFTMNFYGIPIAETFRTRWHSDVVYALSRTANIIVDEAHIVMAPDTAEKESGLGIVKVIEILKDIINTEIKTGNKVLILTATLPPISLDTILQGIRSVKEGVKCAAVVYGYEDLREHQYIKAVEGILRKYGYEIYGFLDEEFHNTFTKLNYEITLSKDNVENVVLNLVKSDFKKIVVFRNTVASACNVFEKLRKAITNTPVLILHGRMSSNSRSYIVEKLSKLNSYILVATQVVEAGVDISFDAGVTPLASPFSIIQRIGRVCRYGEREECKFTILLNDVDGIGTVYSEDLVKELIKYLREYEDKLREGWRWRSLSKDGIDYAQILVHSSPIIEENIDKSYNQVRRELDFVRGFIYRLKMFLPKPWKVYEEMDEVVRGSFIRSSFLIPLVPLSNVNKHVQIVENIEAFDTIEVSLDYLKRRNEMLYLTNGKVYAVFGIRVFGKDFIKDFIYLTPISLERLLSKPMTALFGAYVNIKYFRYMDEIYEDISVGEYEYTRKRFEKVFLGIAIRPSSLVIADVLDRSVVFIP